MAADFIVIVAYLAGWALGWHLYATYRQERAQERPERRGADYGGR